MHDFYANYTLKKCFSLSSDKPEVVNLLQVMVITSFLEKAARSCTV